MLHTVMYQGHKLVFVFVKYQINEQILNDWETTNILYHVHLDHNQMSILKFIVLC